VKSPLVTVGIPFFNTEKWLLDAVRSVFAQSFDDWELILMDDGSTDGSVQIAQTIDDPRIRVYSDGQNLRLAERCNQMVRLARGKYVARFDADDMMHPERLQRQVAFLESNGSVDVLGTGAFILDRRGGVIGKRLPPPSCAPSLSPRRIPFLHPTVMGRLTWFRQNPYDARLRGAQDMELWLRTGSYSRFANLAEPLYFYAEFESFSRKKYHSYWRDTWEVIRRHGPRLVGRVNTHKEILKGYLKVAIYTGAYYCGLHEHLLRRRSLSVLPEEKIAAEAILERIRQQELPLKSEAP